MAEGLQRKKPHIRSLLNPANEYTGSFGLDVDVWILKLDANGSTGDCNIINETGATIRTSNAVFSDTSAVITLTNASSINTNGQASKVCYYSPTTSTSTPASTLVIPGFEAVFAIAGLSAAYIVLRKQ